MDRETLLDLLARVRDGETRPEEAVDRLAGLPFEDLGFARVDTHRALRCGFPEVVFSEGKTPEQVREIAARLVAAGGRLLATRATPEIHEAVREVAEDATWHELARAVTVNRKPKEGVGLVTVLCAGTAGSSRTGIGSLARTPSSSWPAWRARWPRWWAAWWTTR